MRDIVIFGTGEVGQGAIPFLEKSYHILFAADHDEKKWKGKFEKYDVKPPEVIKQYHCDIVITSTKYSIEISKQLQQMGISQSRIYFCHRFQTDASYEYEVYPLDEVNLISTKRRLIQYDLFQTEEHKTRNKKILIFCSFFSTYAKQLIENMSKRYNNIEFSLLTCERECKERIVSKQLKHIYCFQSMADLKAILEQLPMYDAMQLLWIEERWVYFYKLIRNKTKRLNLNVGGSEFYRAGKEQRDFKRRLIACADRVTAETAGTVREFEAYYKEEVNGKIGLLPFGIEVLDFINSSSDISKQELKEKYHIPKKKIVITCGHNAIEMHQHIKLIEALVCLPENVKKQIVCVFPMTYPQGRDAYIDKVMKRLEETGLDYVILTKFMDFQEMAEYALISDIMIHVQTTDQLSSTMLEEMYAGSIVVAGKWLPYQSLHDMGIYFLDVDTIPDVTAVMDNVIANIQEYKEKCTGNKEIVWKHSSWDELAPRWHALWE